MQLSPPAVRVLGALMEKALATPQGYPLSLNSLRLATNQTTGRDPVVDYDERVVRDALAELTRLDLVASAYASRSNTPKYAHTADAYFELAAAETAVLGVLLLRGPQTVGEIRQRTDRLHAFADLSDVQATLEALRDNPLDALVAEVPRQPGQKEGRWRHLIGAPAGEASAAAEDPGTPGPDEPGVRPPDVQGRPGLSSLVGEVAALRDEVETLQIEVQRLRRAIEGPADPAEDVTGP